MGLFGGCKSCCGSGKAGQNLPLFVATGFAMLTPAIVLLANSGSESDDGGAAVSLVESAGLAGSADAAPTPVPTDAAAALKDAKRVGDTIPLDVEFVDWQHAEDEAGRVVTLGELTEDGPVVLIYYRGGWCPYCVKSLKAFDDVREQIEAAGATVVGVSGELARYTEETERKNKLGLRVYSDPELETARVFGIAWTNAKYASFLEKFNGNDRSELPLGVTYIVNGEGEIVWAYLEDDYKERADPAAVVEAVKAMDG
jgi:peroxiredoxin